jgi:hypothetical protein
LVNRSGRRNNFGYLVDRLRLRLRGIVDPLANDTAATPPIAPRAAAERRNSITKTERRRSANLLQMPEA